MKSEEPGHANRISRGFGFWSLIVVVLLLGGFLALEVRWDASPQETWRHLVGKLKVVEHELLETGRQSISPDNFGVHARLDSAELRRARLSKENFIVALEDVVGIHVPSAGPSGLPTSGFTLAAPVQVHGDVSCELVTFRAYDGLAVPTYVLYPPDFKKDAAYPAVLLYSGHGSASQAAHDTSSYQSGGGVELARAGFVVFVMENRGMGRLSYLGDHLHIDAVAHLTGGSWYGEIITDALTLLQNVRNEPFVDSLRIGTAGVSTGGALSMFVAALDDRVAAAYVQGFLGSFAKTFGAAGNHCRCGNIPGILELGDMADIAALIAPRPVCFVNGQEDTFDPADAAEAFETVEAAYQADSAGEKAEFFTPSGVGHELSVDLVLRWLKERLR